MIHLMSTWSEGYASLAELTWFKNKVPYAKKHGYKTRYYIHSPKCDMVWNRVEMWLDSLDKIEEGDFIFSTGCDALITNPNKRAEEFIETPLGSFDFYYGVDWASPGIFGDCFFMRSCDACKDMLKAMLESKRRRKPETNEQDAFLEYLCQAPHRRIKHELNIDFNHLPDDAYERFEEMTNRSPVRAKAMLPAEKWCGDVHSFWPDGAILMHQAWDINFFIVHMGGKSLNFRLRHLPQYMPQF